MKKTINRKNLLAFSLSILISVLMYASIGHLYTSDKLCSSLVTCITQDNYGYIWIGTEYGLSKFDGYHYTNYLHSEADTTTITDNIITTFLVDSRGRLWIGTAKGLMQYDYHNNTFSKYPLPDNRKLRIYSIIESHDGNILVGTAGRGLYSIKKGINNVTFEKEYARRDSDIFFTHIYEDSRGNLWQSSHLSTFTCYHRKGGKMHITDYESAYGAPVKFYETRHSSMLIICMYGIANYDYSTGRISDAGYDFGPYKGNITINNALFDRHGNLYIGTSENGVLVAAAGSKTFSAIDNDNAQRFDLTSSWVNDIFEDKDGNLWAACYRKGVYLINNQKDAFSSWSFSSQGINIGSSVSSIAEGSKGKTYCTVQNSGVFCFDSQGKVTGHPQSPTGTSIIYRDKQGHYWLGTGHALFSYNPERGTYRQEMQFASAGIYCITDDGRGKLYISVYSKGLYIFDTNTHTTKVIDMGTDPGHGRLCNDWIRSLLFDHQGLLWIGTSNGVACMDPNNYAFDTYGWTHIARDMQTNYLCEDNDQNIILGTDKGLFIYKRKENKVMPFEGSGVLKDKQINGIVRDAHDDLWISTTMGIWQYDHQEGKFIAHINGNGLKTSEYSIGAVLHGNADFVGFGTSDGITVFYPDNVRNNRMEMGNVYLTAFSIDGKSIDCMQEKYEIPYSNNSFQLEFSLLNFKNPDDISYQYSINGGDWQQTEEGTNRISFNKMSPGHYTIRVRAVNNGMVSKGMCTLAITVNNPWYATTLAYIIYLLLIGGAVFYGIRAYERRRKIELDEQKMRFLIDATHDIRSPLTLIMGPLAKLKARLQDAESQEDIKTIDRNAQRLLLLVNQILDERKIDKDQMRLHCQETDLVAFTGNILSLYQFGADERRISLSLEASQKKVMVWIDRINFDKVINNLLSNAMKYSPDGGIITVEVTEEEHHAILRVKDTGMGFKEDNTQRIFERFYQGAANKGVHIQGTGIGLNLCRSLVTMHGGKIAAYNRKDGQKGACLEVILQLGNAHLKPEEISKDEETQEVKKKKQPSKNFNILVVDDDRAIAQYISTELGAWYRFDCAGNGKEGLSKLLNGDYDLVISDVMMPEMDGVTMLKNIKTNSNISDIPVILLTSKSDIEHRLEGLKRGADAFLAKPFDMEELHILIDNLVGNVRRIKGKYSGAQDQTEKVENIEVKGNDEELMERVMKCINENIGNPDFNVEMLTQQVGISRAQLHRKMKEITGISTGEFIRNHRLEQAARLIKEGNINVTQVAYSVGFNTQAHFSTVFKKHFGMTPTEYSDNSKKNSQEQ